MKTILVTLFMLSGLLMECASSDPKPVGQIWSQGCAELFPDQDTYRLSGPCCSDVIFPRLDLVSGQAFSVEATKYYYSDGGTRSEKIMLKGQVSQDGDTLTLTYGSTSYVLKPGHALLVCDCLCSPLSELQRTWQRYVQKTPYMNR